MMDYIVAGILLVLIGAAARHVYKAKKSGKACIGCPGGCSCSAKQGCPSCRSRQEPKE